MLCESNDAVSSFRASISIPFFDSDSCGVSNDILAQSNLQTGPVCGKQRSTFIATGVARQELLDVPGEVWSADFGSADKSNDTNIPGVKTVLIDEFQGLALGCEAVHLLRRCFCRFSHRAVVP